MAAKHLHTGRLGEEIACEYLQKKGYQIIHKGWRYKHLEVDIIIYDGPVLVFVEVKTRSKNIYGMPYEAVDWKKQRKLDRAANIYISKTKHIGDIRFDIISIVINKEEKPDLLHIKDAFWPES
jgi:putative endonuclease